MSLPYLLVLLEWEAEHLEKSASFHIVLSGGYDGDVHTARTVDLVLFDLREDDLLSKAKGVIAIAIELLW